MPHSVASQSGSRPFFPIVQDRQSSGVIFQERPLESPDTTANGISYRRQFILQKFQERSSTTMWPSWTYTIQDEDERVFPCLWGGANNHKKHGYYVVHSSSPSMIAKFNKTMDALLKTRETRRQSDQCLSRVASDQLFLFRSSVELNHDGRLCMVVPVSESPSQEDGSPSQEDGSPFQEDGVPHYPGFRIPLVKTVDQFLPSVVRLRQPRAQQKEPPKKVPGSDELPISATVLGPDGLSVSPTTVLGLNITLPGFTGQSLNTPQTRKIARERFESFLGDGKFSLNSVDVNVTELREDLASARRGSIAMLNLVFSFFIPLLVIVMCCMAAQHPSPGTAGQSSLLFAHRVILASHPLAHSVNSPLNPDA